MLLMTGGAFALGLVLANPIATPDTVTTSHTIGDRVAPAAESTTRSGSLAVPFALVGAVAGAVAAVQLGDPKSAGDYSVLARISLIGTGAALGAAAGAFLGSRVHVRRRAGPRSVARPDSLSR